MAFKRITLRFQEISKEIQRKTKYNFCTLQKYKSLTESSQMNYDCNIQLIVWRNETQEN